MKRFGVSQYIGGIIICLSSNIYLCFTSVINLPRRSTKIAEIIHFRLGLTLLSPVFHCVECIKNSVFLLNLLEPEFYIYILAHPVGKMRIIQEPNKIAL